MAGAQIVASLCVLFVVANAKTPFKDCGSKTASIVSLDVKGCSTPICDLKLNTYQEVSVTFTTKKAAAKVTAVVHGIIGGIPVPFPLNNTDGCKDCGLTCPLAAGKTNTYSTSIFVSPHYPKIRVAVKWELKDEAGDDIVCFEIGVDIVDGMKIRKDTRLKFHSLN